MNRFAILLLLFSAHFLTRPDNGYAQTMQQGNAAIQSKSTVTLQSNNTPTNIEPQEGGVVVSLSNGIYYPAKPHYILHIHKQLIDSNYYAKAALYFSRYDSYRYINERRIIDFVGGEVSVELFSAMELKNTYGKAISPLNIQNASNGPAIKFDIHNGEIKEVLLK